jgi:anti-anti-sigma factor
VNSEISVDQIGRLLWVVALRGEHDIATDSAVQEALAGGVGPGATVILDLTRSTFIDSTIIGTLVRGRRGTEAHELVLVAPPGSHPRRVLELVQIDRTVPMFDTLDDAVAAIDGRSPPTAPGSADDEASRSL